jgi:DNA-binding MarR family transcriptional regulator
VSEPVKVLPMAKLLRLAREKEERERAQMEASSSSESAGEEAVKKSDDSSNQNRLPQQTIVNQTIPSETIPIQTLVQQTIPQETVVKNPKVEFSKEIQQSGAKQQKREENRNKEASGVAVAKQTIVQQTIVDSNKGYYAVFNDISDRLIPDMQLDPYQQAVLHRLYRLSRGWRSEECEVGLGTLARYCVMSRSQVQRSVAKLIEKGLVECLGNSKKGGREGNRYRVLPGVKTILRQTIPDETIVSKTTVMETIVREEETSTPQNTVVSQGIVSRGTNKNSNKESLNTHTQADVGGGSKFSLEECRRFAEHLQHTGQGINNPGGYATAIFRSGEVDTQIEAFLSPPAASAPLKADGCPDCGGSGYYYPEGVEKGVKICKHEKLKGAGQR